jgi:WD40 repeat protein
VRQWDLRTGQLLKVYEGVKPATDVVYSADGTRAIFFGGDFPCVVLDLETGQEVGAPLGTADQAICIAASPRGDFAATGLEDTDALAMGNVFLWDLENLEETAEGLHGHADMVYAVAFSPDGKYLASGGRDGLVKIWNVDDRSEMRSFRHGTPVFDLAYSANGLHVISAGRGNTATVWDLRSGRALGRLDHPTGWITAVAISPSGRIAATGGNQYCPHIHIWDLATGRLLLVLTGHEDTVRDLEFTPDGSRLLSCSDDGTMRLWQLPQ